MNVMEKFLGSIGPVSGHTYDTLYDLVFTTSRLIVVNIKHPLDNPISFSVMDLFLGAKLSQKAESLAKARTAPIQSADYDRADFDDLLREHPHSFALAYDAVSSMEVRRRFLKNYLHTIVAGADNRPRKIMLGVPRRKLAELEKLLAMTSEYRQ